MNYDYVVAYTPQTADAIRRAATLATPSLYSQDNTVPSEPQSLLPSPRYDLGGGTAAYKGYFKITAITNTDGSVQLSIEDGAYPGKGKASLCYVNGNKYSVPACKIGNYTPGTDSETFIFLKFDIKADPQVTIIESTSVNNYSSFTGYLLLGRVITSKTSIEVIQSEFPGIPMLLCFTNCADVNSSEKDQDNDEEQ